MKHDSRYEIPTDLRARLERARLELLALFRALDRIDLGRNSPASHSTTLPAGRRLRRSPMGNSTARPGSFDVKAMLRDMLAALNQLPEAIAASGKTLRHAPIPGSKTGSVRPKDGES